MRLSMLAFALTATAFAINAPRAHAAVITLEYLVTNAHLDDLVSGTQLAVADFTVVLTFDDGVTGTPNGSSYTPTTFGVPTITLSTATPASLANPNASSVPNNITTVSDWGLSRSAVAASQAYSDEATFNTPTEWVERTWVSGWSVSSPSVVSPSGLIQPTLADFISTMRTDPMFFEIGSYIRSAECATLDAGNTACGLTTFVPGSWSLWGPAVSISTPEPATLALVTLGLASAAARGYRRR